jgi:hypothetical protein
VSKAEKAARPLLEGSPVAVLAGAFLFNLGQGVLRPTMPLYLQHIFAANYQMVTLIPVAFGLGKWMASLPTGYSRRSSSGIGSFHHCRESRSDGYAR